VHVNRRLGELRLMQLISLVGRKLEILNLEDLRSLAQFNPAFMHLPPPANGVLAADIVHSSLHL
jgi:hypothetical protein